MPKPTSHPDAGDTEKLPVLSLEDTVTARVRIGSPTAAKAGAIYDHDVSDTQDRSTSTGELRMLSGRIRDRRENADHIYDNRSVPRKPVK